MSAAQTGASNPDSPTWDEWFELQHTATAKVDETVEELLQGKPWPLRVAVIAAVIEHLAEGMRFHIKLPGDDQ